MRPLFLCTIIFCWYSFHAIAQKKPVATSTKVSTATVNASGQAFTEGRMNYHISSGDKTLQKLLDAVTKSGNPSMESFKNAQNMLTKEELAHIQTLTQGNPAIGLSLLILPYFGTDIWIQKDKVLVKAKAFTYTLENYWDQSAGTGQCYMVSNAHPEKDASFAYDKDYMRTSKTQTYIGEDNFEIRQTGEMAVVAGFEARKTIYVRKSGASKNVPEKLEVYTSPQLTQTVNFCHPYYTGEQNGIVKITAYLTKDTPPMTYELVKAENQPVTPAQMAIRTSRNVFSTKTLSEQATLGFQLLGIMMDGGPQQAESNDEDNNDSD